MSNRQGPDARSTVGGVRRRPTHQWWLDAVVLIVVAVPTVMDAWWNEPGASRPADGWTFAIAVGSLGALTVRRRWPIAAAVVCGIGLTWWNALGHYGELLNLPTMLALYHVAVQGDRRRSIVVGVIAAGWSAAIGYVSDNPYGAEGGAPMLEMIWPLLPLVLGELVRARRELLAEHVARAARAEADREAEARRRVEEERVRIAREFHDVVAHTLSAVNVQAALAAAAFETQPEVARRAIEQTRQSGREALDELRATVAVLRDGPEPLALDPAPRLDQLGRLADRTPGVRVELRVGVHADDVPAVLQLTAYRIVQEALANVVRHAAARHVTVDVTGLTGSLVVEVTDDGRGADASATGGARAGFGLIGMAERAAAVGGSVAHGAAPGGGFRVRAVLPLAVTV